MLEIIAHRGYWLKPDERNTTSAFERALDFGFGIETDFRDFSNNLYVAHNPDESFTLLANSFGHLVKGSKVPVALNIKSGGVSHLVRDLVLSAQIDNYFVFDLSIPEIVQYHQSNLTFYSRLSEYESSNPIDGLASGYWVDHFLGNWSLDCFELLLASNKNLCFVSPELHGREHLPFWTKLKQELISHGVLDSPAKIQICTDLPLDFKRLIYE